MPDRVIPRPKKRQNYSPMYDSQGEQYHMVVFWDRHPFLGNSAPLRVCGTSYASLDLAETDALLEWDRAYARLRARMQAPTRQST